MAESYLRQHRDADAEALVDDNARAIGAGDAGFVFAGPALNQVAQFRLRVAESAIPTEREARLHAAQVACTAALNHAFHRQDGRAGAYLCKGSYEWVRGNRSAAMRSWEKSLVVAKKLGSRWEAAEAHREIGRRTGDPGHLERAETIFADLGARYELAITRQLFLA